MDLSTVKELKRVVGPQPDTMPLEIVVDKEPLEIASAKVVSSGRGVVIRITTAKGARK